LIGIALITLPLRLATDNPVAIYNLAVLSSFVLSALAMYALARRLRCRPPAAFVAGLVYAFAPLHLAHLTHLGLLSVQYFPLAGAGLLAGLLVAPFLLGYRLVQGDYTVERSIEQNAYYSANLASFFTTDGQNLLWGTLSAPLRAFGRYTFERNMFPGLLALLL